jgi:hypothetical protein
MKFRKKQNHYQKNQSKNPSIEGLKFVFVHSKFTYSIGNFNIK